jgi:riboflavin synthase
MFTGIVAAVGQIESVRAASAAPDAGVRLVIDATALGLDDVAIGDSIAVQGACMTVVERAGLTASALPAGRFAVEVSQESLSKTVGLGQTGSVNLEKALRLADRIGGHLVSGHVDGLGQVAEMAAVGESWRLAIEVPVELARYFAYKGSVTVNGVSLTINRVADGFLSPFSGLRVSRIEINLIAHTMAVTTLGSLCVGDAVNLEVDQIARYCERLLAERLISPQETLRHERSAGS